MAKPAKLRGWAIAQGGNIFVGVSLTRIQAIREHVWVFDSELYDQGYPVSVGPLSVREKRVWAALRKRGHRAIRVNVVEATDG